MKQLFFLFIIMNVQYYQSQLSISGRIIDENNKSFEGALIMNMRNNITVLSAKDGQFNIDALTGDELRIVAKNYERQIIKVSESNKERIQIHLIRAINEIAGVKIISKFQVENMKKNIEVPGPPEKGRVEVPTWKKAFGFGTGSKGINVDAIYKLISGDARKMKALYEYEDQEEYVEFLVNLLGDDFWKQSKLPQSKWQEFIRFLLKKRNIDKVPTKEHLEFIGQLYLNEFITYNNNVD
ncbi:hypothetical protein CMT84_18040 [Elizabethkingia anophelis]|nr:hypothetical protein [Elizabethkingia anophelis]